MAKFCVHEQHGGVCKNTGTYCNLGACPYEDLKEFTVIRHGKWIENLDENGRLRSAWRKCSFCGGRNYSKKTPYCPNCGAKMDGE